MPATTSAPGGMCDLLLVCAIGMLGGGLIAVAAGVTDMNRTFVAVPADSARGDDRDRQASAPIVRVDCPCVGLAKSDRVILANAAPLVTAGSDAAIGPVSPRERFAGETAVMRERARTARQDDPRGFLQAAAAASRSRDVGLFLADGMPPLAADT